MPCVESDDRPDFALAPARCEIPPLPLEVQAACMLPGLAGSNVTQWMGHRPCMPESLPVIGPSPHFANVYFAFGHGHVGLCSGAPTARIVADLVAGRTSNIDITPFRPDRF